MSKIVVLIGLKSYTHDDIISIYNEYSTTMIEIAQQHINEGKQVIFYNILDMHTYQICKEINELGKKNNMAVVYRLMVSKL